MQQSKYEQQLTTNWHGSSIYRDFATMYTKDNWFVILLSLVYFGNWVTEIRHFSLLEANEIAYNSEQGLTVTPLQKKQLCLVFRPWPGLFLSDAPCQRDVRDPARRLGQETSRRKVSRARRRESSFEKNEDRDWERARRSPTRCQISWQGTGRKVVLKLYFLDGQPQWPFICCFHRFAQTMLPKYYLALTVVSSLFSFSTQFPIPHFKK